MQHQKAKAKRFNSSRNGFFGGSSERDLDLKAGVHDEWADGLKRK